MLTVARSSRFCASTGSSVPVSRRSTGRSGYGDCALATPAHRADKTREMIVLSFITFLLRDFYPSYHFFSLREISAVPRLPQPLSAYYGKCRNLAEMV